MTDDNILNYLGQLGGLHVGNRQANSPLYGGSLGQPSSFAQQAAMQAAYQQASLISAQQAAYAQQSALAGLAGSFLGGFGAIDPCSLSEPREPLENTGIELGEITGWRIWRLGKGFLKSVIADRHWAPGEVMEGEPDDYGVNGVNAFKKAGAAIDEYGGDDCVLGRVALWGDIIEHEDGYRAQYALPISFNSIMPGGFWRARKLKRLRAMYGIGPASPARRE